MMQGTDLDWFRRLRAATSLEITAAGGITTLEEVRALQEMNVHAALGMAIYTGSQRTNGKVKTSTVGPAIVLTKCSLLHRRYTTVSRTC
jgi:phosphoribosylformimino-5-aminoimidazole carboxamide ribonucleotide (ProFAR) isomerase